MMKKKLYWLIVGALFCTATAQAQVQIGIKGGFGRSWMKYDIEVPEDFQIDIPGNQFTLQVYNEFQPNLAVGFEPGLARRGAACVPIWGPTPNPVLAGDTEWHLDYLALPLYLRAQWQPFSASPFLFVGKVGGGLSYMLGGSEKDYEAVSGNLLRDLDILGPSGEEVNRWDLGLYGSVGISYPILAFSFTASVDYYHGFIDASATTGSNVRALGASAGILYSLPSKSAE